MLRNTCSADSVIACNSSVGGNFGLFRMDDDVNYMTSCSTNAATAPEDVFSFVPTNTGTASIELDVDFDAFLFGDDMDLYVLEGGCHQQTCIGTADSDGDDQLSVQVTAGVPYYIVVEMEKYGFPFDGDYTLTLTCP